jgi:hypothetical protein
VLPELMQMGPKKKKKKKKKKKTEIKTSTKKNPHILRIPIFQRQK